MFEREGVCPANAPGCPPWWGRHDEEVAFIAALNAEFVTAGYAEGEGWDEGWDSDDSADDGTARQGWDEGPDTDDDTAGPREPSVADLLDVRLLDRDPLNPRRFDPQQRDTDRLRTLRSLDADALAAMTPGAGLAFTLEEADVAAVDTYGVVEVVAAWFRVIGWAQASMARAAAELHRRVLPYESPAGVTHRVVRGRRSASRTGAAAHEIAMRLGLTRQAAQAVIDDGLAFDEALAPVGDRLASGDSDLARARAFVDALGDSPAPTAVDVQDAVLPRAPRRTAPEVRRDIAAALSAVDPAEATVRHTKAREGRRVNHPAVLPDGMAALYAVMPAVDLAALDIALDAAARTAKAGGDPRTIDQLRADALAAVGHGALATGWIGRPPTPAVVPLEPLPAEPPPAERMLVDAVPARPVPADPVPAERVLVDAAPAEPVPADAAPAGPVPADAPPAGPAVRTGSQCFRIGSIGGRPARINVTVPLSVLMGADQDVEEAARRRWDPETADPLRDVPAREVAMLEGYGPVTPDVARALAMGGVWQRLVTDPTSGTVLDVGRTRYTPPPEMADLVRARDRYCVRPGCGTRAQGCDLDHTTPFHMGGRTAVDNLGSLCASDHALKTDGSYRVEQPEAGVFVFHLPSGHSYRRERDGSTAMLGRCTPPAAGPGVAEAGRPVGAPGLPGGDRVCAADGTPCTDADDLGPPPF